MSEASNILADLWRDVQRHLDAEELARVKADPEKHRNTRLMGDRGLRYRYWRSANKRGQTVLFCYATTPNAAGYWLAWDEVENKSKRQVRRENIRSYKRRKDAKESALHRWKQSEGRS